MNDYDKVVKLEQNPIFKFHKKNKKKFMKIIFFIDSPNSIFIHSTKLLRSQKLAEIWR